MNRDFAKYWPLDPGVTFLNHGSFGACPWPVLQAQSELRARLERQPVRFMDTELEGLMDHARARLAEFIKAPPADLAMIPNATTGLSTVLRSLSFQPDDEILATVHEYNACRMAVRAAAARAGARAVVARVPFPIRSPQEAIDAILSKASPRTRLAVISHITSPTALVMPIEKIVAGLAERGIDTLVDGAHAPGVVALDIDAIGAAYYTGNCHKWMCAPKGSGFLYVRRDRQARIHPLVTSHGANSPRRDRSLFRLEFDWTGTSDPTPWLTIPNAIDFVASLLPRGWADVRQANHELVLYGLQRLAASLGVTELPAPNDMLGSMAAVELPADLEPAPTDPPADLDADSTYPLDPLHNSLVADDAIEVPVYPWPHSPVDDAPRRRLLRISAQLYNEPADYDRLSNVIAQRRGVEPGALARR